MPRRRAGKSQPAARLRNNSPNASVESFKSDKRSAQVRQMLTRPGEAWGAESGNDRRMQIKY